MSCPRVSVLMPVYNGADFLAPAVDSVLAQTLRDFELIVVDDGSTDATPQILADFSARDARIRVLTNVQNQRLVASLNRGLEAARAPLIARMDADDIAHPERLTKQVAFLDAHPDHLLVGTSYRNIDHQGRVTAIRHKALSWRGLEWVARFRTPAIHPGFCFRRLLPTGTPLAYDPAVPRAEDFALIVEVLRHGKAAVLPDCLLDFRTHPASIRSAQTRAMQADGRKIAQQSLEQHYPPDLQRQLAAVLDPLYLLRSPCEADVAHGARAFDAVIARDAATRAEARWMKRRAAGMLAEATLGRAGGWLRLRLALAFLAHARRYVGPLLLRLAEDRRLVPPSSP